MLNSGLLTARVSSKGQVALPKPIRDQLGLTQGSDVTVRIEGDAVILRKIERHAWRRWDGRLEGSRLLEDQVAERRHELARDAEGP